MSLGEGVILIRRAFAEWPSLRAFGRSAFTLHGIRGRLMPSRRGRARAGWLISSGFEKRPDVPIRGRRETQDVYALPMAPSS